MMPPSRLIKRLVAAKEAAEQNRNNFSQVKQQQIDPVVPPQLPPSIPAMAVNFVGSASKWMESGFKKAEDEVVQARKEICAGCEFWNQKAFGGTGRCMKCGCSTWAKLRMATEKCPIGKW